jgi:hypothetical protein
VRSDVVSYAHCGESAERVDIGKTAGELHMVHSKSSKLRKTRSAPESLQSFEPQFWRDVEDRVVKVHRIDPVKAKQGTATYRKRVGQTAMNLGLAGSAASVANAVRMGGFMSQNRQLSASKSRAG